VQQQPSLNEPMERQDTPDPLPFVLEERAWHAIHVRARHEKQVASRLEKRGCEVYLPLVTEIRQWSDRKTKVEIPLFSCYVFVRVGAVSEIMNELFQCTGFLGILGKGNAGSTIPDQQIEEIRQLLGKGLAVKECPFVKVGQRVRVVGGTLDGVEGILIAKKHDQTLVISVDAIQRSMALSISGYQVEPVKGENTRAQSDVPERSHGHQ
jgi:transcription antitermination factor NusG